MKKHRQKPLLIGVLILLSAIFLCGRPVAAADPEVMKEIMDISPEDTEFDHYTDEDGIQTYASPFTGNIEHLACGNPKR